MSPKTSDLKKIALINKVLNGGDEGSSKSDTYEFDKHMVYSMTLPLLLLKVVPASKEAILKKLNPWVLFDSIWLKRVSILKKMLARFFLRINT